MFGPVIDVLVILLLGTGIIIDYYTEYKEKEKEIPSHKGAKNS